MRVEQTLERGRLLTRGAIHSTKIPTGPTGKRGPPQKVDPFFRNFSGWTEPIHWVLDRNFRKVWLNGSRPSSPCQWLGNLDHMTVNPDIFQNGGRRRKTEQYKFAITWLADLTYFIWGNQKTTFIDFSRLRRANFTLLSPDKRIRSCQPRARMPTCKKCKTT